MGWLHKNGRILAEAIFYMDSTTELQGQFWSESPTKFDLSDQSFRGSKMQTSFAIVNCWPLNQLIS